VVKLIFIFNAFLKGDLIMNQYMLVVFIVVMSVFDAILLFDGFKNRYNGRGKVLMAGVVLFGVIIFSVDALFLSGSFHKFGSVMNDAMYNMGLVRRLI
jgi:hypothetical protein